MFRVQQVAQMQNVHVRLRAQIRNLGNRLVHHWAGARATRGRSSARTRSRGRAGNPPGGRVIARLRNDEDGRNTAPNGDANVTPQGRSSP